MAASQPQLDASQLEIVDEPPLWKWLIAGFFAIGIGGVLYSLDLFGTTLYYLTLHRELKNELASSETPADVVTQEEYQPLLGQRENQVRVILGIYGFIEKGEFARAVSWSNDPVLQRIDGREDLQSAVEALQEAQQSIGSASDAEQRTAQTLQGLQSQYAILTSRFARSLGMEEVGDAWQQQAAEIARNPESAPTIQFYENGVLRGLPVLAMIPDGMEDHRAIADAVSEHSNNRSLRRNLGWSRSTVRLELEALLPEATELAVLIEEQQQSLLMQQQLNQKQVEALQTARQAVRQASVALLARIAEPEISENARTVYSFVRTQSKGLLGDLPDIRAS